MISLCTVILDNMNLYLEALIDSAVRHTQIGEIIIVRNDGDESGLLSEEVVGDICVKHYGHPLGANLPQRQREWLSMVYGHAYGLHHAISHAQGNYLLLNDPDVYFLGPADQIFKKMMDTHNLNIVGVAHPYPNDQCYLDFPCAVSCMVQKDTLPEPSWLQNELFVQSGMMLKESPQKIKPVPGHYLVPGPIQPDEFPHPKGRFDCGCNLWLWNKERQGRYMTFHTKNDDYVASEYTTNFGLTDSIPEIPLLYHETHGWQRSPESFLESYRLRVVDI